jgi:hypothetical protein
MKTRCILFVFASWLIAKLWWTFEMSRLAFYRTIPQNGIHHVIRKTNTPPTSHWSYEQEHFSIINFDEGNLEFLIYKLPHFYKN